MTNMMLAGDRDAVACIDIYAHVSANSISKAHPFFPYKRRQSPVTQSKYQDV